MISILIRVLLPILMLWVSHQASATVITFDLTDLGSSRYEYTYSVTNDTLGVAIEEFTIYFKPELYDTDLEVTSPLSDWDEEVIQPEPTGLVPYDGFYDARTLTNSIQPDETVTGFSVAFTWLGSTGPPDGSQSFEIYDPDTFDLLDSGTTRPTGIVIPTPGTCLLLLIGSVGFVMRRRFWVAPTLAAILVSPIVHAELSLGDFQLVSTTRVGRTVFDYTYSASVTNPDAAARNVTANFISTDPNITVIDGALSFGDVPSGATVRSQDTFTLRQDRSVPFNQDALQISFAFEPSEPGSAAPVLSDLSAPEAIPFGGTATVAFNFADIDSDIAYLEQVQTSPSGYQSVANLSAILLNINGVSGQSQFVLESNDLQFGLNTFQLRLKDRAGHFSNPVSFDLTLTGATGSGSAPQLSAFAPETATWTRPASVTYGDNGRGVRNRLTPRFNLQYSDTDGDIERVRLIVTKPGGSPTVSEYDAAGLRVTGISGTVTVPLLDLFGDSPLGTYQLALSLIDRTGLQSATLNTTLELVNVGGSSAPIISDMTPASGSAGTEVVLTGSGFDGASNLANEVSLSQIPCDVLEATTTRLRVVVPEKAGVGKFIVRNRHGVAVSPLFDVPVAVTVTPEDSEVVVNGTAKFAATVVSSVRTGVKWHVNGILGGNTQWGTITQEGLYTAPAQIPAGGTVTVSAALGINPAVTGSAPVTILAPPATPGQAAVLAAVGGSVRSLDKRTWLTIPAGTLPADTQISVLSLTGSALPTPPIGQQVLAAAELGPSGLTFATPINLSLTLSRYLPPGTTLQASYVAPNGNFISEGLTAIVDESGERAQVAISHFSTVALHQPTPTLSSEPPTITAITPGSSQEGLAVPVKVTGTHLGADLIVRVLDAAGNSSTDITPGPLYVNGNEAGFLLDIHTIPDLPEGASRSYRIRLERIGGAPFAETLFIVNGLDELIVSGDLPNIPLTGTELAAGLKRYSEIKVMPGANLTIDRPRFKFESTGPVTLAGNVWLNGADGANGSGRQPGISGHALARGGQGRTDSGCIFPTLYDCSEPENWGEDAPDCTGINADNPRSMQRCSGVSNHPEGLGGRPGTNLSNFNPFSFVVEAFSCLAGNVVGCVSTAQGGLEVVDAALVDNNASGGAGFGGTSAFVDDGGVGGGGGGGGKIDGDPGGGGGQGGMPGRRLNLISAETITLGGILDFSGGDGGRGGINDGSGVLEETIDLAIEVGLSIYLEDPSSALGVLKITDYPNTGGGGGGGSGGAVTLYAGEDEFWEPTAVINGDAGKGGFGGVLIFDENNTNLFLTHRFANGSAGRPGAFYTNPLKFDYRTIDNGVTDRTVLRNVQVRNPGIVRVGGPSYPVKISVDCDTGVDPPNVIIDAPNGVVVGNILLCPGFNTVSADRVVVGGTPINIPAQMHELLTKRILVLAPDSDGDGLGDRDEIEDYGTNPLKADSDDDGLNDGQEIVNNSDPLKPDTDGDGLSDGQEVNQFNTNPTLADSDGDGFEDGTEVLLGSSPTEGGAVPVFTPPSGWLLAASSDGTLIVIDPSTGGNARLGQPNADRDFGLAMTATGRLFVAAESSLVTYDPLTDITVPIGLFSHVTINRLTYNPVDRLLYGVEEGGAPDFLPSGQLVKIDPATGATTRIGVPLLTRINALAFDHNGTLYAAVEGSPASDDLVILDVVNGGVSSLIGAIGVTPVAGLTFDQAGALFASHPIDNESSEILQVDPATGASTILSQINQPAFDLTVAIDKPVMISAGGTHTCGLKSSGSVICWGSNSQGQLDIPADPLTQISAGSRAYNCGLKGDRTSACWGLNDYGQATPPAGQFLQVSAGTFHTCGVKSDRTIACWGLNDYGQASDPPLDQFSSNQFSQVSTGERHSCGLRTTGTIVCWGSSFYTQPIPSGNFTQISTGTYHNCAIRTDGTVACWGSNYYGQATPPTGQFLQVSAGNSYTCGVKSDRTIACWGLNNYGQATPPTGQFTQVTAGSLHACAITIDNTTRCWGVIIDDRSGPPLVIYRGGTGTGTVTMSPPGIDCMPLPPLESIIGADTLNWGPNTCYQTYPPFPNTVTVTLTATPDADSAFDGWSDLIGCPVTGSCQITMNPTPPFNKWRSSLAYFYHLSDTFALTVTKSGTGTGVVTSSPGGINCGSDCSKNYAFNPLIPVVPVTLTATPAAGSIFVGWGGACSGTSVSCYVILNANTNVTAAFSASP